MVPVEVVAVSGEESYGMVPIEVSAQPVEEQTEEAAQSLERIDDSDIVSQVPVDDGVELEVANTELQALRSKYYKSLLLEQIRSYLGESC